MLQPTEGNPRRGRVDSIATSLMTFGQKRPVVVDGDLIRAGHHVVLAAQEIGWTHVACQEGGFENDREARAFMIADNRTHDVGSYNTQQLVEQLNSLADVDRIEGTGYTLDDLDDLRAQLDQQSRQRPSGPPAPEPGEQLNEIVLLYDDHQLEQVEIWLKIIAKERGTDGASDAVYEALGYAAQQLNA